MLVNIYSCRYKFQLAAILLYSQRDAIPLIVVSYRAQDPTCVVGETIEHVLIAVVELKIKVFLRVRQSVETGEERATFPRESSTFS